MKGRRQTTNAPQAAGLGPIPSRIAASGALSAQTLVSARRSTAAAGATPYRRPAGRCPLAHPRHRNAHRRMYPSAAGLSAPEHGPHQWALHVPLGKLHTERLVPDDADTRRLVDRMLALRPLAPPARLAKSEGFLLPRLGGPYALYRTLSAALLSGRRPTSPLLWSGHTAPATPHFRCRDAPPRRQPSGSHATAGAQRHPHDAALCAGHPTGLATGVPPGPPEYAAAIASSGACGPASHRPFRPSRNPPGTGRHTPPPGDVPPSVQRGEDPPQVATPRPPSPRRRFCT